MLTESRNAFFHRETGHKGVLRAGSFATFRDGVALQVAEKKLSRVTVRTIRAKGSSVTRKSLVCVCCDVRSNRRDTYRPFFL